MTTAHQPTVLQPHRGTSVDDYCSSTNCFSTTQGHLCRWLLLINQLFFNHTGAPLAVNHSYLIPSSHTFRPEVGDGRLLLFLLLLSFFHFIWGRGRGEVHTICTIKFPEPLQWPSGIKCAPTVGDTGIDPCFHQSGHTCDLQTASPVTTLPCTWPRMVSAKTGQSTVSRLWLGEIASSISAWQHVQLSMPVSPWDTLRMLLGR